MNRETYEKQRVFAGSLKPSMKRRSVDNDYHDRRIYMITIAVEGRRPLLGRVVGDVNAALGTASYPHVEPSTLGAAVAAVWRSIPVHHPCVELLGFQLMPDHIHGILFVTRHIAEGLGKVILGFKQACNKEYRRLIPSVAGTVSYVAVAQQHTELDRYHGLLFERGYNDSILLHEGQLSAMLRYLSDNPFRLAMKRARPDLLRVRQDVEVCGRRCSAVGNLSLLEAPQRIRVRISRSIDAGVLDQEKAHLLAAARAGAVLVSPAISPGEKAITRAAFDEGLRLIVLLDNGLDPMQKPSGERFRACAEGRLLLLSPFPHRNQRVTISRATCEALNGLAWDISNQSFTAS